MERERERERETTETSQRHLEAMSRNISKDTETLQPTWTPDGTRRL